MRSPVRIREVEYRSQRLRETVSLHDVELAIEQTGPLLSTALDFDSSDVLSALPSFAQREVSIDVVSIERSSLDEAVSVMESDALSGEFGTLECDGWSARAVMVSADVGEVSQRFLRASLTLVLADGFWGREESKSFSKSEQGQHEGSFLDFPHDYEHDYASPSSASQIVVGGMSELASKFVIYGPAENPSVTIAGNAYQWNITVPEGGYLVSDGTNARKSITLVSPGGVESDVFACGMRGAGKGSGSYCFEPIAPGTHDVIWDGSFGFDVVTQERRGGLPWTSS